MTTTIAKPRIRISTGGDVRGAVVGGAGGSVVPLKPQSTYMRGNQSPFFFNWNPALRDAREDVRVGYVEAAARSIDAMQNSGWLAGAIDQTIAGMVGDGLRLAARPDKQALGWDAKQANDWSEIVERRWVTWSENPLECDAAGRMSVAQMTDAVLRAYYSHGEALALLPYIRRPISSPGTKVQLLPPHRLVQDQNRAARMYQGVMLDTYGMPVGYKLKAGDELSAQTVLIRARDAAARPQVVHLFDGREQQVRGISPLAPALRVVRQYDQLADATLQAALIQAIFAATIEGDAPTPELLQALQSEDEQLDASTPEQQGVGGGGLDAYLGAQGSWYENTKIDLSGPARVAHLFPGQKLIFNRSEHPNSTYEAFAKFLLREIARCLGMTFETLTGDYSGATYSSVRMASAELWPLTLRRRKIIPARFNQMVYEAWLEEQIEQGLIPFPQGLLGFLANRPAAVSANWRGPAKPQADDLKAQRAHEGYKRMGIMSDERIADDLGFDIGDEYERRKRESDQRSDLDLPDGDTMEPTPEETAALLVDKET